MRAGVRVALCAAAVVVATAAFPFRSHAANRDVPPVVQSDAQAYDALWSLLHLDELVDLMGQEGTSMAIAADVDLLGHPGGDRWRRQVNAIYDTDRLKIDAEQAMEAALDAAHLTALRDFYGADAMQDIVKHELTARRAFLDPEVEERARSAWQAERAVSDRDETILRFIEDNDLVELNVMGALNSNFAFLRAMVDANPVPSERMTEDQILLQVWSQEREIRRDTSEWLSAFLSTAYAPVSDDALTAYVAFSQTEAGQALNHAMFKALDEIYIQLSAELGRAVGRMNAQQDI
ncbi:hypothetical protein [Aliiroseovarius sediminis]|uniref:hypothetical protein n=1 Tax=Aliiroseovarius sediminis TaxID=2925839 RepID=UPI001F57CBC1|nr:hypothetical protein [Aliiroseovarius sediminis]MCI2393653.1 hypothetical protein [Aliiroseovarius sediminis]